MPTYNVHVIIENKSGISDPEGDTILNDLVLKGKNSSVKKISAGISRFISLTFPAKIEGFIVHFKALTTLPHRCIKFNIERLNNVHR